jgi:hypothetical protein
MKKNIMILTALTLSILCVVGFQPNSSPQYRIVECDKNDAGSIQNKINQNSKDGWEYHSAIVIPPDQNVQDSRCNLVFRK